MSKGCSVSSKREPRDTEASETAGAKHPEMHEGTYQRKALCQRMLRKERRRNPAWKLKLRKIVSANRIQKREPFASNSVPKTGALKTKQNEFKILEVLKNSYKVTIFLWIKSSNTGAGVIAQPLRACTTLVEDQGLVSSTHTVPQKCLSLLLQGTRHPLLTFRGSSMWYT